MSIAVLAIVAADLVPAIARALLTAPLARKGGRRSGARRSTNR
jgi:hypothetical protein